MVDTVYTRPTLSGNMRESPEYQVMGMGFTDRLFLLGHSDGLSLADPYLVLSLQHAVNTLEANSDSPLLRGAFEAYYSGARDVWLVSVAPMSEYVSDISARLTAGAGRGTTPWGEGVNDLQIVSQMTKINNYRSARGKTPFSIPSEGAWDNYNYYERYKIRLDMAYELLVGMDLPQLVVPLEAPFNGTGSVSFANQLITHCQDVLDYTGSICLGFLGTRTDPDIISSSNYIDLLLASTNQALDAVTDSDGGKFVSVIVGEGVINLKEFPTAYSGSVTASAVGQLANTAIHQSWIYNPLLTVTAPIGGDWKEWQVEHATEKKLNPLIRTTLGKRGKPFQAVIATDNTLGITGTDYWSTTQMRLIAHIIERIRSMSNQYIGSIQFGEYKRKLQQYMYSLVLDNYIRGFDLNVTKSSTELGKVLVDVSVTPYFGLRQLTFTTEVGPGA